MLPTRNLVRVSGPSLVVLAFAVLFVTDSIAVDSGDASSISPEQEAFFESKIRPLLIEHCYECHSRKSGESSGDLLLDNAVSMRSGGVSGPAIVAGKPDQSLLIRAVRYDDAEYQMPPTGKLSAEAIELLERWVQMGAPDPRKGDASQSNKTSPLEIDPRSHWAFNVPRRYRIDSAPNGAAHLDRPVEHRGSADRDVIDVIARRIAEESGVVVSEQCSDERLIRRLYFDLNGTPPPISEVESYVASTDPLKRERLVDRLIAAPEFAERFARHWMDVARYADTIGYALAGRERRLEGSDRYRDWLIRAFANDMPFDQMVRLQLAADRFDPENKNGDLDAMGFLTIGRRFLNRYDTIDDRIDVITRGLMGMTVACARCHDHKFDPIPSSDYYSLLGILQSSETRKDGPSPLALFDKAKPSDSRVFLRGQPGNRGDLAPRQYLTALRKPDEERFRDGSGRVELAQRLASKENPLVARVYVNRLWGLLVGRPIVDSTSDFGVRTEAPPLVELLDELAAEFSDHWSTKRLVKRIVMSRIYAQSPSPGDDAAIEMDPDNLLAARGNRRRRDFESMRDSILSVCGRLDRTVGGPPVEIHLNTPSPRRTLYAMIDRQNLPSLFRTFDFASPDAHTPRRLFTTVPQQALFLMNHPQMGAVSRSLAERISGENESPERQVTRLFELVYSRRPSPSEMDDAAAFLATPATSRKQRFDPERAWRYGTSPVNKESRVTEFRPFPVFTGSTWQDQKKLPASSEFSYASIGVENGHPGPRHSVVRRWIAPASGVVSISGMVGHRNQQGDGVELAIWIGEQRVWRANHKSNNRPFKGFRGELKAGQAVDFVVSPGESDSFDSFFLRCQLSLLGSDGQVYEGDSKRDFAGPLQPESKETLSRLAQLAQTLLLSNEFAFVD